MTDIITFDYSTEGWIYGDLVISIDRVTDNATCLGIPFEDEIHRVVIHGILHMLGYKDKSKKDKALMTEAENLALLRLKELIISN